MFPRTVAVLKSRAFDGFSIEILKRTLNKRTYWQLVKRVNGDVAEEYSQYDKQKSALEEWFLECERLAGIKSNLPQGSLF